MTRQNVNERCRRICAGYNESSVCRFADNGGLLGFIDTSQGQNGTRGIAFSDKGVCMNFDGDTTKILYKNIKSVQIISSFEDFFADELSVVYSDEHLDLYSDTNSDKEIRISDFSLDKSELKRLIDGFCAEPPTEDKPSAHKSPNDSEQSDAFFPNKSKLPLHLGKIPQSLGNLSQNLGDLLQGAKDRDRQNNSAASGKQLRADEDTSENLRTKLAADKNISDKPVPADTDPRREFGDRNYDIFDNEIPAIFRRQDDFVDIVFEDRAPVITETFLPQSMRARVIESRDPEPIPQDRIHNNSRPQPDRSNDLYEDEAAERIRIQNMSPEETLSFLAQSLNEINSPEPPRYPRKPEPQAQLRQTDQEPHSRPLEIRRQESASLVRSQVQPQNQIQAVVSDQADRPPTRVNIEEPAVREEKLVVQITPLTEEPIWGDIYIKASRNLRELCESGRLSMGQIEKELDSRFLDSAKAFAEIIADESKVPKVLIPKITELKAAAKNFDQYFQLGEDIAVRAMFFMMYQMLSYADRIVETPETKERLNDFFRRYGSAGITLSMLDMRV